MQEKGLRHDQVSQVRDYADQRLRSPKNPFDPSNRRITLIVQNLEAPPQSSSADPAKQAAQPAPAEPSPATKSAAVVHVEAASAPQTSTSRLLARLHSH
jgi:chemotaxis protein MotB